MKVLKKVTVIALLISMLSFAACCILPLKVTKAQYDAALQEAIDAERRAEICLREKNQLESELNAKNAKLSVLQEMEREMN
jgi:heme A synthase